MSDPTAAERIANLRDLVNNQNVNGLNAGQATAVARELDGILASIGTEVKPDDTPPLVMHGPEPPPEPEPPRRGRRV
jgi:hypothetical protein